MIARSDLTVMTGRDYRSDALDQILDQRQKTLITKQVPASLKKR